MKRFYFLLFLLLLAIGGTANAEALEQKITVTQMSTTGITAVCDTNENYNLYAALYKNDELTNVSKSNNTKVKLSFNLNSVDDYMIKIFCWSDAGNMKPLSLPLTIDCNDLYDTGILKNIYKKPGGDWYAQIIAMDGTEEEYKVDEKDVSEYGSYLHVMTDYYSSSVSFADGGSNGVTYGGDSSKLNCYPQQVISYHVSSSGKIKINNGVVYDVALSNADYNAETNSIGSIKIGEDTVILDISDVNDDEIRILTDADLSSGLYYETYGYMNSAGDGSSGLVIITASEHKTVILAAEDFDYDHSCRNSSQYLYFYPAGTTRGAKGYALGDENGVCQVYINKTMIDNFADIFYQGQGYSNWDALVHYIYDHDTSTVKLEKTTAYGNYSRITIYTYETAIVEEVIEDNDNYTIVFDTVGDGISALRMEIEKDNEGCNYTFKLDDEEIDVTDLQPGDVLSIAFDHTTSFWNSDYYDILVSRNTAEGMCTAISTGYRPEYTIDGTKYIAAQGISIGYNEIEPAGEYILYLDYFGRIAKVEKIEASK